MLFIELRAQDIRKIDRNIITRIYDHGAKPDQPVHQHLTSCAQFAEYLNFYTLPDMMLLILL